MSWLTSYSKQYIIQDVLSGISLATITVPQSMAYAVLAGLPPVYGLYASTIPSLVYAFLGTSRHLSFGNCLRHAEI